MDYSLIIPYFKTPEVTRLCLHSVFHFARGNPEVILVDNAPDSPESAMLREFPRLRVLANRTPHVGSAGNFHALDVGLEAATHELVGLLHSDTVFLHDGWDLEWFERLAREDLAALSTFEREANPFRPWHQRLQDRWHHLWHQRRPGYDAAGKLMMFFFLTRRSVLRQTGFVFLRDGHIGPKHFEVTGKPVEVLSLVEISRFMWHISNVTSLLTGQMDDPKMAKSFHDKRRRFLADPRIREHFGPVLPAA